MKGSLRFPAVSILAWLGLVLGCMGWAPRTMATTAAACTAASASINIPPVTITGTPSGLFGSPGSASITFDCPTGTTAYNGAHSHASIQTFIPTSGVTGSGTLLFATNIPGISVQLTLSVTNPHSPGLLPGNGNEIFKICESGDTDPDCKVANAPSSTATFIAQLYATGSISKEGATSVSVPSNTLISSFENYTGGYSNSGSTYGGLTLNPVAVTFPACAGNSPTVTLPAVSTTALTSSGATAGATLVPIQLTGCTPNIDVKISFSGSQYAATVLKSSTVTGSAANVQVQLLDGGNSMQPVDITGNQNTDLGNAPSSGNISRSYYAQYYATGQSTAGSVNATVTYTLIYP